MATVTLTEQHEVTELPQQTHGAGPKYDQPASPQTRDTQEVKQGKFSKGTYLKLISVGFSFFVAGVNDGSIGALLPYVIREYHINTAIVSSM